MKIRYLLAITSYTSWSGLGFIRGINSYNYNHNKYRKEEDFIYLNLIINGIFGIIIYANPLLLPFSIYKEIYKLEVDLRKLENEKNSRFYNDLI